MRFIQIGSRSEIGTSGKNLDYYYTAFECNLQRENQAPIAYNGLTRRFALPSDLRLRLAFREGEAPTEPAFFKYVRAKVLTRRFALPSDHRRRLAFREGEAPTEPAFFKICSIKSAHTAVRPPFRSQASACVPGGRGADRAGIRQNQHIQEGSHGGSPSLQITGR
jgi:uncharacterized protein (DUF2336 family)